MFAIIQQTSFNSFKILRKERSTEASQGLGLERVRYHFCFIIEQNKSQTNPDSSLISIIKLLHLANTNKNKVNIVISEKIYLKVKSNKDSQSQYVF